MSHFIFNFCFFFLLMMAMPSFALKREKLSSSSFLVQRTAALPIRLFQFVMFFNLSLNKMGFQKVYWSAPLLRHGFKIMLSHTGTSKHLKVWLNLLCRIRHSYFDFSIVKILSILKSLGGFSLSMFL